MLRGTPWRRWLWLAAAAVTGGLIAAGALLLPGRVGGPPGRAAASAAVTAYRRVAPSVVLVGSAAADGRVQWGSGLIFDRQGDIVTNDHVIAGGGSITVVLADGQRLQATLVAGDAATDLAVVRVQAGRPLPAARFAPDSSVEPGETVVAIGNPLGPRFALSVTQGVVSAVRPMLYGLTPADRRVTEMIQTDAAINPGNSGGPLCDAVGQVIGITSIQVPQAAPGISAAGLGFAIPADTVRTVVTDLIRYGYVRRAWLGVYLQVQPADVLPGQPQVVAVGQLVPGGPAARAGLLAGERLLAWDGQPLRNYYDLVLRLNAASPGQQVRLTVASPLGRRVLSLHLGAEPPPG